jgi:hypothetical protein
VVRYADDFLLGFEYRAEAERFRKQLRERLTQFGLELHPEKTRLIELGRQATTNRNQRRERKAETFDFLGFTPIGERNGKTGRVTVRRKRARQRLATKLRVIPQPLRQRRHEPMAHTGQGLQSVMQGYFNYQAVPGNTRTLGGLRPRGLRLWRQPLCRRSQKAPPNGKQCRVLRRRWIPSQRILHPFPRVRFDATHPR